MSKKSIGFTLALAILLSIASFGCQRGQKSCRYYSLRLMKSEDPAEKIASLRAIRALSSDDQITCDDDKVFERFASIVEDKDGSLGKFRVPVLEAAENIARANPSTDKLRKRVPSLKKRVQGLFLKGLGHLDSAPVVANIISTWRREAHERGEVWVPQPEIIKAMAAVVRRVKDPDAKDVLMDAIWLSLPKPEDKLKYVDLWLEAATTKPSTKGHSIGITIKALQFLTELKVDSDKAFDAYVYGLFVKDAARAEAYGAARLALSVIDKNKVASRILGIYTNRDASFSKWAKAEGLHDWEWQEGPKLTQVLADLHDGRTAQAIVARVAKPFDASSSGKPKIWDAIKRGFPWDGYINSRLSMSLWGLAGMGQGLSAAAEDIGKLAATSGPVAQQRNMPFIALSISGADNAWTSMAKAYNQIKPAERGDFITPLSYAVEPATLDEWQKLVVADKSEAAQLAIKDPTIVGRVQLVTQCKQTWDAAADAAAKKQALFGCYSGFLKTGDNIQKEKAAIGLVHLGAQGMDVIAPLLAAFEKSSPADTTLRQVLVVGLKVAARNGNIVKNMKAIYRTQQLEVQKPNNKTWDWEFEIILNHMRRALTQAAKSMGGAKAPSGAAPAAAAPATTK